MFRISLCICFLTFLVGTPILIIEKQGLDKCNQAKSIIEPDSKYWHLTPNFKTDLNPYVKDIAYTVGVKWPAWSNIIILCFHELLDRFSLGKTKILISCLTNLEDLYYMFKHTLWSGLGHGSEYLEKADPGPLEKEGLIPKIIVWVKNSYLTNSKNFISNMRIVF